MQDVGSKLVKLRTMLFSVPEQIVNGLLPLLESSLDYSLVPICQEDVVEAIPTSVTQYKIISIHCCF